MATTEVFGWDELSAAAPADVPYRVNILAGQIDADLGTVDVKASAAGTKNAAQDTRLDAAEAKNTAQDTRLDAAEAKNTAQDLTLADHGAWLTDLNTASEEAVSRLEDIEAKDTAQDTRLDAAEAKNTAQDTRLDAAEAKNTAQDTRLDTIQGLQPVKAVKLEAGKYVWDLPNATHYLFPEPAGGLSVHATAWPVPNPTTPALDW